ncbi:hypothetical protein F5884DRAFT_815101 [Xylogone sp. PMI_703]|nr:hypothetical protein F5884DRAFT_815101 [Xylogone sp. PMI_703]
MSEISPLGSPSEAGGEPTSFQCSICSKTFSKRLSRNRHVLYCRQKQLDPPASRQKSCERCRQDKTRCSLERPFCSRCRARRLACIYQHAPRRSSSLKPENEQSLPRLRPAPLKQSHTPTATNLMQTQQRRDSETPALYRHTDCTEVIPSETLDTPNFQDVVKLNLGMTSDGNTQVSFYNAFDPQSSSQSPEQLFAPEESSAYQSPPWNCWPNQKGIDGSLMFQDTSSVSETFSILRTTGCPSDTSWNLNITAPSPLDLTDQSIPASMPITPSYYSKSLYKRRRIPFNSQLGCVFLIEALRSYPRMMLSEILPPFIHPTCSGMSQGNVPEISSEQMNSMKEPLTTCKTIIQIYSTRRWETNSFLWRAIEMEQARLCSEHANFDSWTLLAAVQAITLYIIIASLEGDTSRVDPISPNLLLTMTVVASRIENNADDANIVQSNEWHNWILQESITRTFILLFIINMIFDIDIGITAHVSDQILALPLPATKYLWEAKTETEWKKEYTTSLERRGDRPALTYGDLILLRHSKNISENPDFTELSHWCANFDSFGNFILMTAMSI